METAGLYTTLYFYHEYIICFLTASPTNYADTVLFIYLFFASYV